MNVAMFPGQGAQFVGMGKDLYNQQPLAQEKFNSANRLLGFSITDIMFEGDTEALKETKVTQPAIFLHSVIIYELAKKSNPDMAAGHSLGEFSALTACGALSFEDGLSLVSKRAQAMQAACDVTKGTMAAVLALADEVVEQVCRDMDGVVVAANYNCPGQLVISGAFPAVESACEVLKEKGAKRAMLLPVGGAFHSPLMEPAQEELAKAILETNFNTPSCPIYQNVTGAPTQDADLIKENLIAQLTGPVKWTQTIKQMREDGASLFTEYGPGKVLQGLVKKIDREGEVQSAVLD
ncbi:MAG: [acyl-carrier-protein] S-malonyltransferase [Flavobacteriaceae bacterium]|nr:[acyl-carrier-protein] S-malonyltransferase [Flavobacteriaceae bacterium]|tara:strand:- start:33 stop:914 length:882 start_codon:yes stop_codon:yes gene_type:complete